MIFVNDFGWELSGLLGFLGFVIDLLVVLSYLLMMRGIWVWIGVGFRMILVLSLELCFGWVFCGLGVGICLLREVWVVEFVWFGLKRLLFRVEVGFLGLFFN